MTTVAEVQFALTRQLLSMAQGGTMPVIVGVHSTLLEDSTAFVNYDVRIGPLEELLFFEFPLPATVAPGDLTEFSAWLAFAGNGETAH